MRCPALRRARDAGRRLARPRRFGDHPPPPRVLRLQRPVHHLRARRGGPPRGRQARRQLARSSTATSSRPGLRKALTRRPVPDGAAEQAADEIEAELRAAGADDVPSLAGRRARHGEAPRHRPDRLHPLRQRLPELRGPRGPEARGRHALRRRAAPRTRSTAPASTARTPLAVGRRTAMSVLSDRDIRAELDGRPRPRSSPYDPGDLQPSSVDLHLDRSFRVFRNNRYAVHRRPRAPAGPDRAAQGRRRRAVHPPPRRVRPRPDPRVGRAARRPRGEARGEGARARHACPDAARLANDGRAGAGRLRLRRVGRAHPGRRGHPADARPALPRGHLLGRHSESSPTQLTSGSQSTRTAARMASTGPRSARPKRSRGRSGCGGSSTTTCRWRGPSSIRTAIDLPIEPYTLGAWLGDGTTTKAEITCYDEEILANVSGDGYAVRSVGYAPNLYRIGGVGHTRDVATGRYCRTGRCIRQLRSLGLMDGKFVPRPYLESGVGQRLALLQGLMDTDGFVDDVAGRCEFTSTNESLADAVVELAASLGFRPIKTVGRATLDGVDHGPKYRVKFTPDRPVFRLDAKAQLGRKPPTRGSIASAPSTRSGRSLPSRSAASRSRRRAACSSSRARSSRPTTAPWAASGCSSTRRRATSTRAGRAT